jgi:hypothetical protein
MKHPISVSIKPAAAQPDDLRLSDIEPRFTCKACGKRGGDVRPNFSWNKATTMDS